MILKRMHGKKLSGWRVVLAPKPYCKEETARFAPETPMETIHFLLKAN